MPTDADLWRKWYEYNDRLAELRKTHSLHSPEVVAISQELDAVVGVMMARGIVERRKIS